MVVQIDNVLSWGSNTEPNTIEQAAKTSRLPIVSGHVALMPDAHVGIGSTVGSVVPTKGAVIPSCIGVDIGCGMIAASTGITASQLPDTLDPLLPMIAKAIPSGVGRGHSFGNDWDRERHTRKVPTYTGASVLSGRQVNKITDQFGTLGSGNHFVELCLDEDDNVWLVLHSGSRGIGNQLAQSHIAKAKGVMKDLDIRLEDPDLAYLMEDTPEFQAYISDMLWAQDYAYENRRQMMGAAIGELASFLDHKITGEVINCHHNYTVQEIHFGQRVWLTRKGAIRAGVGDLGIIPGSMGTSSYIVEGLGNPDSYMSSSHGAGRRMSRGEARRNLTVDSLREAMGDRVWLGQEGNSWSDTDATALLDEHPDSYKDIDQVMDDQKDLVKIVHQLHQILNYKGT